MRQTPGEHTDVSLQSEAGHKVVPKKQEDAAATRGEGPAPPTSRLGLGDLRHSLQVRRESQHHGQSKKEPAGMEVPSGVSVAPKSWLGQQRK